jgi:hypothetical protein
MNLRAAFIVVLGMGMAAASCERARLNDDPSSGSALIDQPGALRTAMRPTALSRLYRWVEPEGLPLNQPSESASLQGRDVSIGPLETAFPMETWTSSVDGERLKLAVRQPQGNLLIPVRVPKEVGVRICRFRVNATNWQASAEATRASGPSWQLQIEGEPTASLDVPRVTTLGECPELSTSQAPPTAVEDRLIAYAEDALAGGMEGLLAQSPIRRLGLPQEDYEVLSASAFGSRQGSLRVTGVLSASPAPDIEASAIRAAVDLGVQSRRAGCAPSATVPPVQSNASAGLIAPNTLGNSPYALGVALSGPVLEHLLRTMARAGFACRGLESRGIRQTGLKPETAELDEVGLAGLPLQGPLEVGVSAGSLPNVDLESTLGALSLRVQPLRVELYGRIRGARVRLLRVSAITEWRAVPEVTGPQTITLSVDDLDVTDLSIESAFGPDLPGSRELNDWVARLFTLALEDQLMLPAPVLPDSPIRFQDVRVRPDDILLLGRLDPPPQARP